MIKTLFADYCEKCNELEPIAIKEVIECISCSQIVETTIVCEHREKCNAILKHLKDGD